MSKPIVPILWRMKQAEKLIIQGFTNTDIANRVGLDARTVHGQRRQIVKRITRPTKPVKPNSFMF